MSLEPRRHRALSLGAFVRRRGLVLSHVEIFGERLLDRISGHDTTNYSNRWHRRWRRAQSTRRAKRGPAKVVLWKKSIIARSNTATLVKPRLVVSHTAGRGASQER